MWSLWPFVFVAALVLMFFLVPQDRIMRFLLFGLVGGFGIGIILLYLMTPILGFWQFNVPGIIMVSGIPVLLAAAWIPLEIIYAHYFPKNNNKWTVLAYLLSLPVLSVAFHWLAIELGQMSYHNWSLAGTLLISVIIQTALAFYLYIAEFKQTLNGV